jgi:copper transport protein
MSAGLQGLDALDAPMSAIRQTNVWLRGFATAYGATLGVAIVAMGLGLIAIRADRPTAQWCASFAMIGSGVALAASGHAAAGPELVTRPAVFLHGVSVAFWAGALIPLGASLQTTRGRIELARFSRTIPWPLAVLVVSGGTLAVLQVQRVEALWTTSYGIVLCCKIAAVAGLLALGAANRWRTPGAVAGDAKSTRSIRCAIVAEVAIVAVILGLVASWRFTPPPRALSAAANAPVHVHIHAERAMADVRVEPASASGRRVTIGLLDGEFRPLAAKEVTLLLSKPDAGIESLRWEAHHVAETTWRIDGFRLPLTGRWRLRVEILINDFERIALEDQLDLVN